MQSIKMEVPRIRMILPIWGIDYIERWLDLTFPAIRSEGNILYLNEHSDFDIAILTKSDEIAYMQDDARFKNLTAKIRVHFITIDEFFPPQGTAYGVPLTLAYAKGVLDLGDKAIGTYIILGLGDVTFATGSFKSVLKRIRDGFSVIGAPSLRVIDNHIQNGLQKHLDKKKGVLSISPREMTRLVFDNSHNTLSCRILNEKNPIDSSHYHQMYWRISDDCIAKRGFLIHPLCFQIQQNIDKVLSPIDYGFVTQMCPDGRFCLMNDSDEFMVMEMQARDSESHMLRLARKGESTSQRLTRLSEEISENAATWTTVEHRRNAGYTVLFHENDLPPDLPDRIAPFEAFVDKILATLPPPISSIGHFHWLHALNSYRLGFAEGGGNPDIALIDDPHNLLPDFEPTPLIPSPQPAPTFSERVAYAIFERPQDWKREQRINIHHHRLNEIISSRLDTKGKNLSEIYLGNIDDKFYKKPVLGAHFYNFKNPFGADGNLDFVEEFSSLDKQHNSDAVLVFAPAGFLSLWNRLYENGEAFLTGRKQFILAFAQDNFFPVNIAEHSYFLSAISVFFSKDKYDVNLDIYLAPKREPAIIEILFYLLHSKAVAASRLFGLFRPRLPKNPNTQITHFSALVLSVKWRQNKKTDKL